MDSFAYGSWYSGRVWWRVKLYQRQLDAARTLLDCDLFMAQQVEDPFFEKERKVKGRNRDCQNLLDEIAVELRQDESAPGQN